MSEATIRPFSSPFRVCPPLPGCQQPARCRTGRESVVCGAPRPPPLTRPQGCSFPGRGRGPWRPRSAPWRAGEATVALPAAWQRRACHAVPEEDACSPAPPGLRARANPSLEVLPACPWSTVLVDDLSHGEPKPDSVRCPLASPQLPYKRRTEQREAPPPGCPRSDDASSRSQTVGPCCLHLPLDVSLKPQAFRFQRGSSLPPSGSGA